MVKHLGTIEEFTMGDVPVMLDQLVETAKKDLKKIKKKETKLNTSNQQHIEIIQQT